MALATAGVARVGMAEAFAGEGTKTRAPARSLVFEAGGGGTTGAGMAVAPDATVAVGGAVVDESVVVTVVPPGGTDAVALDGEVNRTVVTRGAAPAAGFALRFDAGRGTVFSREGTGLAAAAVAGFTAGAGATGAAVAVTAVAWAGAGGVVVVVGGAVVAEDPNCTAHNHKVSEPMPTGHT